MKSCFLRLFVCLLASAVVSGPAAARTLSELLSSGYTMEYSTKVDGDFRGCTKLRSTPFKNGMSFTCFASGFAYAHEPTVFILYNAKTLDRVLLLNGAEYEGVILYKRSLEATPVKITVGGGPVPGSVVTPPTDTSVTSLNTESLTIRRQNTVTPAYGTSGNPAAVRTRIPSSTGLPEKLE